MIAGKEYAPKGILNGRSFSWNSRVDNNKPGELVLDRPDDISFQDIDRASAQKQLSGTVNGTYLMRTSKKGKNKDLAYALSLKSEVIIDGKVTEQFDHYKIIRDTVKGYYIDGDFQEDFEPWTSFQELIYSYQK